MTDIMGTSNIILEVDLSSGRVSRLEVSPDERRRFLGGKGLGLYLLSQRLAPGADPLGPENVLAIMPGVLMGSGAPCSARWAAVTKSPLTGLMTSSSCGGSFGLHLKKAGWDGLLIRGASERPVVLELDPQGARLRPAGELWGQGAWQAQESLPKGAGLVIGPAGENLARMANLVSGRRYLGRGGMGAVLGAKKLKAIVVTGGDLRTRPVQARAFAQARRQAAARIKQNPVTARLYRELGTAANLMLNQKAGILPVRNFAAGQHAQAPALSGEALRDSHATRHHPCQSCTILCGKKGRFGEKVLPSPEYETLALLGTNLGIFDPLAVARFNELCGQLGLDTISAGGVLAWVMEAAQEGIYESPLRFGATHGIEQALIDMAMGKGQGQEMALGVRALSQRYGGQEFAMQVKGLELPGYDPRGSVGQGLAYATANRGGCHLSAFLVALEVYFGLLNPQATRAKPQFTKFFEDLTCCVNSLHTCQFTMFAYLLEAPLSRLTPKPVLGFLMQNLTGLALSLVDFSLYRRLWCACTGLEMSNREFLEAGERIHVLERLLNTREGVDRAQDTLPARLLDQTREEDAQGRTVPLEGMLEQYYRLRGYDPQGAPTPATLERLGI